MSISTKFLLYKWPGNSVGTETRYGLDRPGIESRHCRGFPCVQTGLGAQNLQWVTGLSRG